MVGGKGQALQLGFMEPSNRLGSVALHELFQGGRRSKCAAPFQAGSAAVGDPTLGQLLQHCRILTVEGPVCSDQSLLIEEAYSMLCNWNYYFPLRFPQHDYGMVLILPWGILM